MTTFTWVALNVHAKQTMILWKISGTCSNHELLLEQPENLPSWEGGREGGGRNLDRIPSPGLITLKGVERNCELAKETTQQLHKVSTPCLDHHHFKEEALGAVGESSKVCSRSVLEMSISGTHR